MKHSSMPRILTTLLLTALCATLSPHTVFASDNEDPDPKYDRLDGRGLSGKKVQVIEWEGNLEIHVYPQGSLAGLALKLDKKDKNRPVMVIGYRFDTDPGKQLIRRNILGIDLSENFKTYRDLSAEGYDKIIISNNGLSNQVARFKLDPEPGQLYPEGHPANGAVADNKQEAGKTGDSLPRMPASSASRLKKAERQEVSRASAESEDDGESRHDGPDANGTIRSFKW